MNKGYFESGIVINDIIGRYIFGLGAGVYYRWGYYSLPDEIDNFAFKMNYRMKF